MCMVKTPDWPADRLKALIDRILDSTGLNQTKLSALAGINPSQVSRWVNGSSRPKFETLAILGKAIQDRYPHLEIGPDELTAAAYPREAAIDVALPALQAEPKEPSADTPLMGVVLPPELGEIKDPSPAEAAMLAYLAVLQEELKAVNAQLKEQSVKLDALAAEHELDRADPGNGTHGRKSA